MINFKKIIKIGECDISSYIENNIIEDIIKCTKIEKELFKKYGRKIILTDLEKIGFKNISFIWRGDINCFSCYHIYTDYTLNEDEYPNFLDYNIQIRKDNTIKIYRECEKYFAAVLKIEEDKEWEIQIQ